MYVSNGVGKYLMNEQNTNTIQRYPVERLWCKCDLKVLYEFKLGKRVEKLKARHARKLRNFFQLMRWKDTDKF